MSYLCGVQTLSGMKPLTQVGFFYTPYIEKEKYGTRCVVAVMPTRICLKFLNNTYCAFFMFKTFSYGSINFPQSTIRTDSYHRYK
jgi:hypothetical protein